MVIQLTNSAGYNQATGRNSTAYFRRTNLSAINSKGILQFKASDAALKASLERTKLNNDYWEKLLEKLRKSGGGGSGNNKSFDRIAVSMMLSNFISKKAALNLFRNFTSEKFALDTTVKFFDSRKQDSFDNFIKIVGKFIAPQILSVGLLLKVPVLISQKLTTQLISILGILSFQLNKLKEILEEDLKESIRKLDVKTKLKEVKTTLTNAVVSLKEGFLEAIYGIILPLLGNRKKLIN